MKNTILVGYASRFGSTREVAEKIAETLNNRGVETKILPLGEIKSLSGFDAVVIGAPLFMFHWHPDALSFLNRFQKDLLEKISAVFALGPAFNGDEAEWDEARKQFESELSPYSWFKPNAVKVFGGCYDPDSMRFPHNLVKLFIPRSIKPNDLRDWDDITSWTSEIVKTLVH